MGALPKALARRGHRTMAVVPRYSNYEEGWETGVRIRLRVMGSDTEVRITFSYTTCGIAPSPCQASHIPASMLVAKRNEVRLHAAYAPGIHRCFKKFAAHF